MGLLDDLQRALVNAAQAAQRTVEEEARRQQAGKAGAAPSGPAAVAPDPDPPLPRTPGRRLAIVTCMDTRGRLERALGLRPGDAHILRNAGGIVTDDVLRSLLVSHHALGTRQIFVIGHTDCAMATFRDEDLRAHIQRRTGATVSLPFGSFTDLEDNVRRQVARVRDHPGIPDAVAVRGFVFDLRSGTLRELDAAAARPTTSEPTSSARRGGRLQRERLERVAPAAPSMVSAEPSDDDFRRKVDAMASGEPEALGVLSPAASAFDLTGDAGPEPLSLEGRDMLRAILLGEALDEPKGRRTRRPHPR